MQSRSKPKQAAVVFLFVSFLGTVGCGNKTAAPGTGPAATVTLKDGSTFSGNVTKSDASSITVENAAGESRTYPMTSVSTVQYGDAASPGPSSGALPPPPPAMNAGSMNAGSMNTGAPNTGSPSSPAPAGSRPPEQPREEIRTIPAGTNLQIRNNEAINSQTASSGQTYSGVVAADVLDSNGRVAIPKGSDATLVVREAVGQGKIEGRSELVLDVGSVSVAGRSYRLETSDIVEKGREGVGANKRTAIFAGGGSAFGGIVGALAGGGKGAAIGAISGAAAGTATQAVTRGKGVRVPSETVLSFKLEAPVQIREAR